MRNFRLFALSFLFCLPLISSCYMTYVGYPDETGLPSDEGYHQVVQLGPGGTLSLENSNGDIRIIGWDGNELEVIAEKRTLQPYDRRIQIYRPQHSIPEIDFDRFEDFIKIKTISIPEDKETSVVDYDINVPYSINLKGITQERGNISIYDLYGAVSIALKEGDINIENFSGSLNVAVIDGSVSATLYDLRSEDEDIISTEKGDIVAYLQPEVKIRVEGSAPNGEISSEFDFGISLPAKKISTQIGKDGALLSLSTLNGDIRIKKID
ncbi:DUF4097 family beta strand repeat-containing protein [Acidobacteriota bacterium]